MKIQYHGHSCFSIYTDTHHLIIDPFLSGNPLSKITADSLAPDVILLTHGHNDHFGDTLRLAAKKEALVIAPFELAELCQNMGVTNTHAMQIGGGYQFDFGYIKLTPALHSSSYTDDKQQIHYTGNPCGIIFKTDNHTIYHAGDTGLSQEMSFIGNCETIDVALLPIGGNFTMDGDDAVKAAKLLKPKHVIPMHYNTFDVIKQNPQPFAHHLENAGISCHVLAPEEFILLS